MARRPAAPADSVQRRATLAIPDRRDPALAIGYRPVLEPRRPCAETEAFDVAARLPHAFRETAMSVHFASAASGAAAAYRPAASWAHACHRPAGRDDEPARRAAARAHDDEQGNGGRRAGGGLADALRAALEAFAAGASAPGSSSGTASETAAMAVQTGGTNAVADAAAGSDMPATDGHAGAPPAAPRADADREALRDFTHALLDALRESGAREVGHGPGRHLQRGHAWGHGGGDLAQRLEALAQRLAGDVRATDAAGSTPPPGESKDPPSGTEASATSGTGSSMPPGAQPTDPSSAGAPQTADAPTSPAPTGAGVAVQDTANADGLASTRPTTVAEPGAPTAAHAVTPDAASATPQAPGACASSGASDPTGPLSALEEAFAALWDALPSSGGAARPDARDALAGFLHALAAGLGGAPTYGGASPYGGRATAGVLLQARA